MIYYKHFKKNRLITTPVRYLKALKTFFFRAVKFLFSNPPNIIFDKILYFYYTAGFNPEQRIRRREYKFWLKKYNYLFQSTSNQKNTALKHFINNPLISLLLPFDEKTDNFIELTLQSIIKQSYQNWELCIIIGNSISLKQKEIIKRYASDNTAIKVINRKDIKESLQLDSLDQKMFSGEWIALLEQNGMLAPDALFQVVRAINANSDVKLIYTDEDKLDDRGRRYDPYFKPQWDYFLFLSKNFINHLGVYKTEIVKKTGTLPIGPESLHYYDFSLKYIEQINQADIIHIPIILYHSRVIKDLQKIPLSNSEEKFFSMKNSLTGHLERTNKAGEIKVSSFGNCRIYWKIPSDAPSVDIIIPTRNNVYYLRKCIESILRKTYYPNYKISVIDNNSSGNETLAYLKKISEYKQINVIHDKRPFNYASLNNRAVELSHAEIICFLNDDTEIISSGWLTEMVGIVLQKDVGAVGAKLVYPDRSIQHGGVILGIGGVAGHAHRFLKSGLPGYHQRLQFPHELSCVTAACLLIKKETFLKAGGFDEVNLAIALNDVDLCLKIRELGYKIVFTPHAELFHHENVSREKDMDSKNIKRYQSERMFIINKWGHIITADPAYSPNLTLEAENFGLAWPPRVNELWNTKI